MCFFVHIWNEFFRYTLGKRFFRFSFAYFWKMISFGTICKGITAGGKGTTVKPTKVRIFPLPPSCFFLCIPFQRTRMRKFPGGAYRRLVRREAVLFTIWDWGGRVSGDSPWGRVSSDSPWGRVSGDSPQLFYGAVFDGFDKSAVCDDGLNERWKRCNLEFLAGGNVTNDTVVQIGFHSVPLCNGFGCLWTFYNC